MKRDDWIDFHTVRAEHAELHRRLENWARWVIPRSPYWISPMFKLAISKARARQGGPVRDHTDPIDAMRIEKAVAALPAMQRAAIRWSYVYKTSPASARRELGVTYEGLFELLLDARAMLKNTIDCKKVLDKPEFMA